MADRTPIVHSSTVPGGVTQLRSASSQASLVESARKGAIYERSLQRKRGEVSESVMALVICEAVQYLQKQAKGIADLEDRLNRLGYHMGQRVLELITLREGKSAKRETKVLGILQFIHTMVWRTLFGRPADALERSTEDTNQYMIIDNDPLITRFISVPKDMAQLNCAAFAAGIIEAVLDASLFTAKVTAHTMGTPQTPDKTVYLVQFESLR
ncbi:Transport protein particle subunit trs31 [Wickerhamiella sorbophila]|uniref:Trafficking protein particle complex subunit n=1 Tax=Wickerhamiella sorbophila TaxID=45607 RepID=A0A2T0FF75_9ASCO|nr:Transport protein particle subunit trs31 [Wickerhamiella sorbophila]PRT53617.1 Transport protein particle subunit trs31 [Wickerhamiella sorbophila]